MFETLALREWSGIVLDTREPSVRGVLRQEYERRGGMVLWEFQHFYHHEHPFTDDSEEESIREQEGARKRLCAALAERFPERAFVVETEWLDRSTWYQAFADAPTEDEQLWHALMPSYTVMTTGLQELDSESMRREFSRRTAAAREAVGGPGRARNCPFCAAADWAESYVDPAYRGVRWMNCRGCDRRSIEATHTIRDVFGPNPGIPVPELHLL